jgi:dipeptidyl aminopeptidase/acylaminoacyl peptidase
MKRAAMLSLSCLVVAALSACGGEHSIRLTGIAMNCATVEPNPQSVTVSRGATVRVPFSIACLQTGSLAVTTSTSGDSIDAAYTIVLEGVGTRIADANGTVRFDGLLPGEHAVTISDLSVNCTVSGDHSRTVSVASGATAETTFEMGCTPALLDRIVFASERDGNSEIYSMTDRGTDKRRLTDHPAVDQTPALSPGGTKIVFASDRDGDFDIYVMEIDGSGLLQLTNAPGFDGDPAWSPDGDWIAFTSQRDGDSEIYAMAADGTGVRNLTSHRSADRSPAWSPDGSRIAFSSDRLGNDDICVVNLSGVGLRILTRHLAADATPAWSPDGTQLAFATVRDGAWEIYTVGADGSDVTRLTYEMGVEPAWASDGRRIAYATDRDGDLEIYYSDLANPSRVGKLTDDGRTDTSPSWSPER